MTNREMPPEMAAYAKRNPAQCAMIEAICKGMAPVIREFVEKGFEKLCQPLHDRIKALEARPEMKYFGVWAADKVYGTGNFVTDAGSVWHAQRASVGERPGAGGDGWVLAVKKGKDVK